MASKHNISIFPVDYYLLTWFSGCHNKRHSLQNLLLWKKAETNGSVVCLVVQIILCLKQERTSLHTKQGTNSGEGEAAQKPSKGFTVTLIPVYALCMSVQLWLKHRMWSWQKLFIGWVFNLKLKKSVLRTFMHVQNDATELCMSWLLHGISGSSISTELSP